MTTCQTITLDFDDEIKNTRKMLERVSLDASTTGFKPHEKSMPLGVLATHVAEIPGWMKLALEAEVFELAADYQPHFAASTEELLATFDKSAAEGRAALEAATDADMAKNWTFKYKDFSMTDPRTKVVRSFLNHMVHHRAQLSVYLRMQNVAIPGMYGPSADEAM